MPSNFKLLIKNVFLGLSKFYYDSKFNEFFKKIKFLNKAIAEKEGYVDMYIPEKGNWSSLYRLFNHAKKIKVESIPLHKLLELGNIEDSILIRMDVEGYEYNIIKENIELFNKIPNIFLVFEFHTHILGTDKSIELLNLLEDLGFKLDKVVLTKPVHYSFLK